MGKQTSLKKAHKTREQTLRVKQRIKSWCELGTQRKCTTESWQGHNTVCYWRGIIKRYSGFELRQLLSSVMIRRLKCLLFLIFLQIVLWLFISVWRPKGQRFKCVCKPQVIFLPAQLSQGKMCWAQVVLSFALGSCACREHPTCYSRDPGSSRQGSDISYGNMQ